MKINLETYELFVMDYLEGKLSSKQMAEFDAFLLIHPEIKSEIDDLNSFQLKESTALTFDKNSLKKDLFSEENIHENFEELCIEYIEKGLNELEEKRFEEYIANNPSKNKVVKQFKLAVLKKDFIKSKENFKNLIKKIILTEEDYFDEIAIAYTHNDLTKGERFSLEENLVRNSEIDKKIKFYNKLILNANKHIIYNNKSKLKQKEQLSVFIKYTLSIAASILFLILVPTTKISENKFSYQHDEANYSIESNNLINNNYTSDNNNITNLNNFKNKQNKIEQYKNIANLIKSEDTLKRTSTSTESIELITRKINIREFNIPVLASNELIKKPTNYHISQLQAIKSEKQFVDDKILKLEKVKFWKVASIAVNLFSKATKSEILLNSEYDENGKLIEIDFVSSNFNYTKQYSKQ